MIINNRKCGQKFRKPTSLVPVKNIRRLQKKKVEKCLPFKFFLSGRTYKIYLLMTRTMPDEFFPSVKLSLNK